MGRPPLADSTSGDAAVEWLFVDLNAFFASVEQQERPELRGKPVAVVPLVTPNTVCIAASYEARPFGVKTGVKVHEAQRLCPGLTLVEGRPKLYVAYHHRLLEAIERCVPVTVVMSIDEAACRLMGRERALPNALAIARAVKAAVRGVGETLRCSIGLAPNRYLAKVASDMHKPDGLTPLLASDLPQALFRLELGDLPGIGRRTEARLQARGVRTVEQLCGFDRDQMRALWGGVQGARMWHWLRGADLELGDSGRKSLGRQHVLGPEQRTRAGAFTVAQKLLHLAAAELRHQGLRAGALGMAVNFLDDRRARAGGPWVSSPSWKATVRLAPCRDTLALQAHLRTLWESCPDRPPILVYVWLHQLTPQAESPPSLFDENRKKRAGEAASDLMDELGRRFGPRALYPASLHTAGDAAPTRIAFRHVPRLEQFE